MWPPALTTAAEACLTHDAPAALAWGPDSRLLYNEAYAAMLGDQHPGVRGRPAWEAVPAMWPVVGPLLHRVRTTGEPRRGERVPLPLETSSGPRTHWYSWTYDPVWCDGTVQGVFAVVHDDTAAELAARHAEALASAREVTTAADLTAALSALVDVLGALPDVRLAVGHRLGAAGTWVRVAHAGSELRRPTATSLLDNAEAARDWPLAPPQPESGPYAVRHPDEAVRGLGNSWSVSATVGDVVVALTIGFRPTVGDPAGHKAFVEQLAGQLSDRRASDDTRGRQA